MACGDRDQLSTNDIVPIMVSGAGPTGCRRGGDEVLVGLDNTNPGDNIFYQIVENAAGQLLYIEISISTLYDTSLSFDPITNPRYTATTQISPAAHSR